MAKNNVKKMTSETNVADWRQAIRAKADKQARQAATLEAMAAGNRLVAMAETPEDAAAVAWDIAAAAFRHEVARHARANGDAVPPPPAPISKLLTGFASALTEKLVTVGSLLSESERVRLAAIGPNVIESIEENDKAVVSTIATLMQQPPDAVASWLQNHLGEIEARFAS